MITNGIFHRLVLRCIGSNTNVGNLNLGKVAVAISGGVDSMCLAYMVSQYKKHYEPNLEITGITIDHRYRLGSDEEAQNVGSIVQKWGLNHIIVPLLYEKDVNQITNFEEVARTKRYEKFDEICREKKIENIFVGHNLDDQVETFLYRLLRNSSLFGLVGLKVRSPLPVRLKGPFARRIYTLRPLLEVSKSDIIDTCIQNGVPWFEDVTNSDIHLTRRNLLRHLLNNSKAIEELGGGSKSELATTVGEVATLVELVQTKASDLESFISDQGWIQQNRKNGSLILQLPITFFKDENLLVVSQLLFSLLLPFSSVKYYYWSYTKLERKLVPRVAKYLAQDGSKNPLRLTYLNLVFEVKNLSPILAEISIWRQPALRYEDRSISLKLGPAFSTWYLFDNRFWLRAKLSNLTSPKDDIITITAYIHKQHRKQLHPGLCETIELNARMEGVPVIFYHNQIVSFPSYEVELDEVIETNCHLKQ